MTPSAPTVRPLAPHDEATVAAVFEGLTAEQRWHRFHAGMPRLSAGMRRRLADVDGWQRVALVLELDGRPVGIGRYARLGPRTAELAVEIVHEATGRGLGTHLVEALIDHAAERGVVELRFQIGAENTSALRMARARGATLTRTKGSVEGALTLVPAAPVSAQ